MNPLVNFTSALVVNSTTTTSITSTSTTSTTITPTNQCYRPTTPMVVTNESVRLFLLVLYSLTALFALTGNLVVLVVQLAGKETAKNIRKYLINLAISDLLVGVLCMPVTYHTFIHRKWPAAFPEFLCPMAQFVQLLGVFVTSMTLTIIGVERYTMTFHSLSHFHRSFLPKHGGKLLLLSWVLGAAYATIPLQGTAIREKRLLTLGLSNFNSSSNSSNNSSNNSASDLETFQPLLTNITLTQCSYHCLTSDRTDRRLYLISNLLVTFVLPCSVLVFAYISIVAKLAGDQRAIIRALRAGGGRSPPIQIYFCNSNRLAAAKLGFIRNRLKSIKILLLVLVLFCLCWAPIKVYQLLHEYDLIRYCSERQFLAVIYIYIGAHWLAMANSMLNPLVYSFWSTSFRNDLRRITSRMVVKVMKAPNL
ncbi:hypothetical protein TYRP_003157 [Tyrophagus putrescentiae]|nr:hypothetical protein TYRP_003157 [Tyrophagus putrescentiae]